ncbi:hypothetical protein ACTFIR_005851 [Dictyostelium discoideum]
MSTTTFILNKKTSYNQLEPKRYSNRDEIVDGEDFFRVSLNGDLKYSLDIGRKDLFWELLDWIEQYMIKNENSMRYQVYQFNSPYESLLPDKLIEAFKPILKLHFLGHLHLDYYN